MLPTQDKESRYSFWKTWIPFEAISLVAVALAYIATPSARDWHIWLIVLGGLTLGTLLCTDIILHNK